MCLFRVSCFYWVYAQFLKIQISTNDEVGLLFLTWPHTQQLRYSWTLESAKPMSYLNGLVVFPIFFNLSLNLAIRSSWSEPQPQLPPGLVFADYIELLHPWLKNINNLVLVLTIWWCPCVELSLVLLEEGVCYDQYVLLAKLLEYNLPWPSILKQMGIYFRKSLPDYWIPLNPNKPSTKQTKKQTK